MNEGKNTLLFEDKKAARQLLEHVNLLIKDSDAIEEKEMVKQFLKKVSQPITITVEGNKQTGKTTFLNNLFQDIVPCNQEAVPTVGIREVCYGAEEAVISPVVYYERRFLPNEKLQGLRLIDTQGMDTITDKEHLAKIKEISYTTDVLIVLFSAESVNGMGIWEILESTDAGKILFVLSKCDCASQKQIDKNEMKLKQYMAEADITAPIFRVSAKWNQENVEKGGFDKVREYIKKQIIGESPVLTKQSEDIQRMKSLLEAVSKSFDLRKRQYEADMVILNQISLSMNSFYEKSEPNIHRLKEELRAQISGEIDSYRREIIGKLDTNKIKKNFKGGNTDFQDYLTLINESYKRRMNQNVSSSTQRAVKQYLSELEQVFEEATGYFRKRKNLITLEDKFYGTLAENKKNMLVESEHVLVMTQNYYATLTDASEELFMKIWNARGDYDKKMLSSVTLGSSAGTLIGGSVAYVAANAIGAAAVSVGATTATIAAIGTVLWPIVGALIGAAVIGSIVKKLSKAKNQAELEKVVRECINDFNQEISNIKQEMTTQILDTVETIFKRELSLADKTFADFRMSVNIDSQKVPFLEEKLNVVGELLNKITEMERRMLT